MKILILTAILIFAYTISFSQKNNFDAYFFFNANGIEIQGDNEILWNSEEGVIWGGGGLSIGVGVNEVIKNNYHISMEIRYIRKGSVYEYTNQFATQSFENISLNYIETPIIIGRSFPKLKHHFSIETGIAPGRIFSSKLSISDFAYRRGNPNISNFKNFDWSWIVNIKFPIMKKRTENLLFGIRSSYSIFSIHKDYTLRNFDYGLEFSYLFRN